ncbi:uncharacterized protein LOC127744114 [Arachis duranensis]|uniref:Uncharacterized protein LOC107461936 n=1 Tax=Arachis duranensis TaxID=130453 RepID=A0A6P4B474_ARADU|nr:uncharacterized protein LOC107461936 [Arachis duranensis]XP_052112345.1 uncharacterized protein LOC127744114 [Arachis duranensis]
MRLERLPDVESDFGDRDSQDTASLTEFQVGQQFQNKEEVVLCVKTYSIYHRVEYKVMESDHDTYYDKCKEFGNSCRRDHRKLDYHVIFAFILPMIKADAAVSIKVLQNATEAHFGFRLTYRRVWLAKQKAVVQKYGNWEEAYNELPRWVLSVKIMMPGSIEVLKTSPMQVGDQDPFVRKIWKTLLVAIAHDGNSNTVHIAFFLVGGENAESWSFFLSHLLQHMTPQQSILVISDRNNGIKAALEVLDGGWVPPAAYRAFRIKHVAANFTLSFKGKDAMRLLVNAAYAKIEVDFDYWFDILRTEDLTMCDWANMMEYDKWT